MTGTCSSSTTRLLASNTPQNLTDGSLPGDTHLHGLRCRWTLCASSGNMGVHLAFTRMHLESCCDRLYVYNGNTSTSLQLGVFTGSTLPANVTSFGQCVHLYFQTDYSVAGTGWALMYRQAVPVTRAPSPAPTPAPTRGCALSRSACVRA